MSRSASGEGGSEGERYARSKSLELTGYMGRPVTPDKPQVVEIVAEGGSNAETEPGREIREDWASLMGSFSGSTLGMVCGSDPSDAVFSKASLAPVTTGPATTQAAATAQGPALSVHLHGLMHLSGIPSGRKGWQSCFTE